MKTGPCRNDAAFSLRETGIEARNSNTVVENAKVAMGAIDESSKNISKVTGEALATIANHVSDINDHINSIATASREQATGLQEVSSAVSQMDQGTQQNAAMVEETTALTHRLSDEANQLASLVQRFRLAGAAGDSTTARPAAKAKPAPVAAGSATVARPSPAKAMVNKVRQAFASNGSAAVEQEWSEF